MKNISSKVGLMIMTSATCAAIQHTDFDIFWLVFSTIFAIAIGSALTFSQGQMNE